MAAWLENNFSLGTVAVLILLALLCAAIVRKLISDRRAGKLSCGGNCASCGACKSIDEKEIRLAIQKTGRKAEKI